MVSNLQQSRVAFAQAFSEKIAPITGKTYNATPVYQSPGREVVEQVLKHYDNVAKLKTGQKKSNTKPKAIKKTGSGSSTGPTNNPLKKLNIDKSMTEEELKAYLAQMQPEQAADYIENELLDQKGFRGWSSKFGDVVEQGVKGGLDLISRPAYTLFNALDETTEGANEGQQPHRLADDFIKGAWGGLSGKDKSGFGEVVENVTRPQGSTYTDEDGNEQHVKRTPAGNLVSAAVMNPVTVAALRASGKYAADNPDANFVQGFNENSKRALGAWGEIGADPLNVVGGAVVTQSVKGQGAVDRAVIRNATRDIVEDAVKSTPGLSNRIARTLGDDAEELINKTVLDVKGGARRGTTLTGGRTFAPGVSSVITGNARTRALEPFERLLELFTTKKLSNPTRLNAARQNPLFGTFYDELTNIINDPKFTGVVTSKHIEDAAHVARAQLDDTLSEFGNKVFERLDGEFFNAPGVRVGRKTIPFKRVGKAWADNVTNKSWENVRSFSYNATNPGRLANVNAAARSMGFRAFKVKAREITEFARTLTSAERNELTHALQSAVRPADQKMAAAYDYLKTSYDDILADEVEMGVRSGNQQAADNYNYLWLRGNDKKIREFKKLRKGEVNTGGSMVSGIDEAKSLGLKPEGDAFKNLQYRVAKSQRDITRAHFTQDLLDHYGFQGARITPAKAKEWGLVEVKRGFGRGDTTMPLRNLGPKNEPWYLPKDIDEVLQKFKEMSTLEASDQASKQIIKAYDWFLNKFKFMVTVPYPGFHIRNMIGDVFMGLLDGVTLNDYKAITQWAANRFPARYGGKGAPKFSTMVIGNQRYKFDEIWELFQKHAQSGGYIAQDQGQTVISGGSNAISRTGSKISQAARTGSEGREDLMRFAHFVKALKKEINGSTLEQAAESASWRVNKYKFDYGGLMPFEKKLKRVIPFYTYMRKAIPVLLESMYTSPKWLAVTNRAEDKIYDDEHFNPLRIPAWAKEAGVTNLTPGEEEPWMMSSNVLPTSSLSLLNEDSAQGLMQNLVGNTAPLIKAPFEIATGRSTFNAAPAISEQGGQVAGVKTSGLVDYLTNSFLPPVRSIQGAQEKGRNELLLGDRMGLGLGITQLKKPQQASTLRNTAFNEAEKIEKSVNPMLQKYGYRLYFSNRKDGASYKIKNTGSEQVIFDGNAQEALDWIDNLTKTYEPTEED